MRVTFDDATYVRADMNSEATGLSCWGASVPGQPNHVPCLSLIHQIQFNSKSIIIKRASIGAYSSKSLPLWHKDFHLALLLPSLPFPHLFSSSSCPRRPITSGKEMHLLSHCHWWKLISKLITKYSPLISSYSYTHLKFITPFIIKKEIPKFVLIHI